MASLAGGHLQRYLQRIGCAPQPDGADGRGGGTATAALPPADLRTAARLHAAHLEAIPFENLSLQVAAAAAATGPPSTDIRAVYAKLVGARRGGYCFEQNGLFGAALRGLGFDVVDGAARVVQAGSAPAGEVEEAPPLPTRSPSTKAGIHEPQAELRLSGHDHHILFLWLGGRIWLADVGFGGDALPLPLRLPLGAEDYAAPEPGETGADAYADVPWAQQAGDGAHGPDGGSAAGGGAAAGLPVGRMARYRVRLGLPGRAATPVPAATPHFRQRAGYYLQVLSPQHPASGWRDLYFFRLDEFLPQDFALANHYITGHPESHFRKNLILARSTPGGRVTLFGPAAPAAPLTLRVWRDGAAVPEEEAELAGEEELRCALRTHFAIDLPSAERLAP